MVIDVDFYELPDGTEPVREFLDGLEIKSPKNEIGLAKKIPAGILEQDIRWEVVSWEAIQSIVMKN